MELTTAQRFYTERGQRQGQVEFTKTACCLLFSFNFFPMIKYLRPAAVHSDSNCCLGLQDKGWSEPAWDGVRPEYVPLLLTYA